MLEAKSMYFGGEIINASDCNYKSTRELGIVCPFCSSAVFLRSHSTREVKGKIQLIRPYFAHYPTGNADNFDCEKRSHSKQGRERIEQIKIQARNQRLKLYNAHLWEMIAESHDISYKQLNKARKVFGERWCEQNSILVRHEWGKCLSSVYTFLDEATREMTSLAKDSTVTLGDFPEIGFQLRSSPEFDEHYLLRCDVNFHKAVCKEVADFLTTNSAGFVFHKLFKYALCTELEAGEGRISVNDWKKIKPIAHISAISIAIASTKWTEFLQRKMT